MTQPAKAAAVSATVGRSIQRKCDCGAARTGTKCPECEEKAKAGVVQRSAADTATAGEVPSIVHDVLQTPGVPLDRDARGYFEPRFGADFSQVRVHTDPRAAESARAVGAHAYTVGNHVVFGDGEYAPQTPAGRALLAHELTHTIQQDGLQKSADGLSPDRIAGNDAAEQEAAHVAAAVLQGDRPVVNTTTDGSALRRLSWGVCPKGTNIPANDKSIYGKAERVIVGLYPGKPKEAIVTNEAPLNSNTSDNPLIEMAKGYFFREASAPRVFGREPDTTALASNPLDDTGHMKQPTGLEDQLAASEGRKQYEADNSRRVSEAPDLIDFAKLRVFDVTTVGKATDHGETIATDYVPRLNEITSEKYLNARERSGRRRFSEAFAARVRAALGGRQFAPGRSEDFPQPRPVTFPLSNDPNDLQKICFGVTDLDAAGVQGVLQYRVVQCETPDCAGATDDGPTTDLEIATAGKSLIFKVPAGPPEGTKAAKGKQPGWVSLLGDANIQTAHAIAGLVFLDFRRQTGKYDLVRVAIDTRSETNPKGLRISIDPKVNIAELKYDRGTKRLLESTTRKKTPFEFPGLSPGELTEITFRPDQGLSGKGVIRPSIPLLRGAELHIAFDSEALKVTAPVPKEKLKSLPGLRITEAGLNFELSPEFKPSGDIKFEIGPKQKPLGVGSLSVSADEQGFLAQGHLDARVPGFDDATADVSYRKDSGWKGRVELKTSKSYVKTAAVTVGLSDQGFDVGGNVQVVLPGDQEVGLDVKKNPAGGVVFTGHGKFNVPGGKLDPVEFTNITWDGERVSGTGHTGFKFKGFTGNLTVTYQDGKFSGTGSLDFEKGKAKGKLRLKMSPEQKFSGEGELTYRLTDNLIGTAGIAVDEQEKVTVKGAIEFPKPIQLFKPFGGDREIFSLGVSIPIPGASVGPVGLVARFEGSLSAGFAIGPGELRNVKLVSTVNPFEDKPDLDIQLSAQFYMGASARVSGTLSGAIMVDAVVASVSGGLKVTATAVLDGHVASNGMVHYHDGRFEAQADFEVALQLILKLALDAFVKAQAGVGPFKKETSKEWNLAGYTYDPGLKLGMKSKKPIVYDSSKGFEPPGLDDFEVTRPSLSAPDILQKTFSVGGKPEVTKE